MNDYIEESDMNFIPDNSFRIEKSKVYDDLKHSKIKTVEFIRVKGDRLLLFVEAKPRLHDPDKLQRNVKIFEEEIIEIKDKFIHALNLFSAIKVGVKEADFPDDFVLPKRLSLTFILVVKKNSERESLKAREKLMSLLPNYLKTIWEPKVFVLNYTQAKEQKLTV
ncbi:MAG: hypothetical protein FWG83_01610 [Oscillospiraceae bacterium]|nr:hypothetical protein [Oscillospiraceae bacterium]